MGGEEEGGREEERRGLEIEAGGLHRKKKLPDLAFTETENVVALKVIF